MVNQQGRPCAGDIAYRKIPQTFREARMTASRKAREDHLRLKEQWMAELQERYPALFPTLNHNQRKGLINKLKLAGFTLPVVDETKRKSVSVIPSCDLGGLGWRESWVRVRKHVV